MFEFLSSLLSKSKKTGPVVKNRVAQLQVGDMVSSINFYNLYNSDLFEFANKPKSRWQKPLCETVFVGSAVPLKVEQVKVDKKGYHTLTLTNGEGAIASYNKLYVRVHGRHKLK